MTRAEIRSAVAARLVAAGVAPADQVVTSRATPYEDDHPTPFVSVYTPRETSQRTSIGAPVFARTTEIAIEAVTRSTLGDDDIEDALDALGDDIEDALLTSPSFLAQFRRVERIERESDPDVESSRRRGAVRISLSVVHDVEFVPVNVEDDFTKLHVEVDHVDPATGEGDGELEAVFDQTLAGPP